MDENTIIISASGTDTITVSGMSEDTVLIDLSNISMSSSMTYPAGGLYSHNWDPNLTVTLGDPGSNFDGLNVYMEERGIVDDYREAEAIRKRNPGVQAAWEQYQIMLNLAREDEQNGEDT